MAYDLTSLMSAFPGMGALVVGLMVAVVIIAIVVWIYTSLAFMAISRKAKQKYPGLAWIPGVGPIIVSFIAAKMSWWPWLLLIGVLVMWIPMAGIVIYSIAMIIFAVYAIIWQWKLFEKIGKPGWWAVVPVGVIIPIVGFLFEIGYLVLIGIAAWSKK